MMTCQLPTLFLDILSLKVPNRAQNGNQGSIRKYSLFGRLTVTGLIGASLSTFFRIPGIRDWNPKSPVLRGGKPALLFPIGWQIVFEMGWSKGKGKRRPVFGGVWNSPQNQEKTCSFTRTTSPSETIFPGRCPTPQISLIREKTALMFWEIRGIKPVW
jgi:hypothetical protein